jgi:hypothetical protein
VKRSPVTLSRRKSSELGFLPFLSEVSLVSSIGYPSFPFTTFMIRSILEAVRNIIACIANPEAKSLLLALRHILKNINI